MGVAVTDRRRASPGGVRRPVRPAWPVVAALVILVVAVLVRALTLTPPNVTASTVAATSVRLPGSAPDPRWPAAGEAALVVQGMGSLGSGGGTTPRPTASLAKVMTAYLTLRRDPLSRAETGFTVTVTPAEARAEAQDARQGESVVAVRAGEQLDERQLLEALLIPSGDNIADILAAREAGSVSRFVAQMNRTARALGMDRTTYTDPSGFAPTTVSDADDQLRVFQRAMRFAVFRQIVSMPTVTLPVAGTVGNYDPLLDEGYDGKTGSDSEAEGCLAFFKRITVDGHRLTVVGVVLGQGVGAETSVILGAAAAAAQNLVASVAPAIQAHTVLPARTAVAVARSPDGQRVAGVTAAPLRVIGWGGLHEHLSVDPRSLGRDLPAGADVGEARLAGPLPTPSGRPARVEVRTAEALPAPGILWRLAHLL